MAQTASWRQIDGYIVIHCPSHGYMEYTEANRTWANEYWAAHANCQMGG